LLSDRLRAWFRDRKFGVFIHAYAVPAWGKVGEYAEWYWNKMADKKPGMSGGSFM